MTYSVSDYVDLDVAESRRQWQGILARRLPAPGTRQEAFVPVETVLCLAAMLLVDNSKFGGQTRAARAPEPVPALARLFRRPPTSVIAKMDNLDGTRPKGGKFERPAGAQLRSDTQHLAQVYRAIFSSARASGIGPDKLPDFLNVESGGDITLLGQDELAASAVQSALEREHIEWTRRHRDMTERETERMLLAAVRVGQHRFAHGVLQNCGSECVFCGFSLDHQATATSGPSLLRASHIKPWSVSSNQERLDVGNGIAACPTHDAAFDAGLLTLGDDLEVRISDRLFSASHNNPAVAHAFGSPPLRARLVVTDMAIPIGPLFVEWHRSNLFVT